MAQPLRHHEVLKKHHDERTGAYGQEGRQGSDNDDNGVDNADNDEPLKDITNIEIWPDLHIRKFSLATMRKT